ncbi:MAG TPA: CPBP family intramembrane metalloprotease [Candidatus Korarchaeota archaeon]|nr:CPBP family intramembrane metalloprotease [Candidatus Korarchaeota archaeon]
MKRARAHWLFVYVSCKRDQRIFLRPRPIKEIPKELLDQLYYIGLPEEFTCRGLLISHLSLMLGDWQAALASALMFGIFHLPRHGWIKAIECTLSGLLYAFLMVISRSVWPSVILHVALNVFVRIERRPIAPQSTN